MINLYSAISQHYIAGHGALQRMIHMVNKLIECQDCPEDDALYSYRLFVLNSTVYYQKLKGSRHAFTWKATASLPQPPATPHKKKGYIPDAVKHRNCSVISIVLTST